MEENKPVPWNPEPWQMRSVEFLLSHANAGLLLDPGMRKTSATLAAISVLLKEKLIQRALIIAPVRPLYLVWPKEQYKWKDFNHLRMSILHDKHKEKALETDADIYLINPEGLPWLMQDNGRRLKELSPELLCIDELSKFKRTSTQRFKLVKPWLNRFKRRWGLTGSPTPNGYIDLFGQAYVLDMGNALGQYITHYRTKYFYPTGFGGYEWRLQNGAEAKIQERLKPLMLRMDANDYIKLPKLVNNPMRVDLPPNVRKIYKEMEDEMFVELDNTEVVTAASMAVASMKCCQIANGGLYYEEKNGEMNHRKTAELHEAKNEALGELIEELQGKPLLIGYEFEHDLHRMRKLLGKDMPYIGGGVSTKRAIELERMWNKGELPWLAGHPASIAHGLNLQEVANHLCWYSLTWDYELYDQFVRRLLRSGNKHSMVFEHVIIARDTVDEVKVKAIQRKAKVQNQFLAAMNDYRKSTGRKIERKS